MKKKRLLLFVPLVLAGLAVFTFVVMSLWNWLIPAIVGWQTITFWQALGLLVLCKILFGGFHGGRPSRHSRRGMMERWESMTPEERERFREGMRGRCDVRAEETKTSADELPRDGGSRL